MWVFAGFSGNLINIKSIPLLHISLRNNDILFCIGLFIYVYMYCNRHIDLVVRVFTNGPGKLGSVPGGVIPKTIKNDT